MSYEYRPSYEEGQTKAVCSKCGVPYLFPRDIVKLEDGFFYCRRTCLEKTVLTRDRIIAASRRRREMPPPKFVIPPRYAEDYSLAEDAVFRTVIHNLPTSTDPTEIGWGVRYLADMVIENKRPTRWIHDAKLVIATACNFLLTLQYGAPLGPAPTLTPEKLRYGGFADGSNLYTSITVIAGAALTKAYSILGTQTYLDAAGRCAHFLRHMQCQDLDANGNQTTYGGANYHVGGFAEGCSASGAITWATRYNLFDIAGGWFLGLLRAIQGGATVYGGVAGTDFTASTAATLDVMITEVVNFATLGAKDTAFGGQLTTGLSTTYPNSGYAAQSPAALTNNGSWYLALSPSGLACLIGRDVALALFSLNALSQGTAQVNSVFDWLMSFGANPANAAPVEDAQLLIGTLVGTYNPKVALADYLDVTALTELAGARYDWLAAGLLSPIASVRIPTQFGVAKDTLGVPNPSQKGVEPVYRWIGETGKSGLSLQFSP